MMSFPYTLQEKTFYKTSLVSIGNIIHGESTPADG